MKPLHFRFRLLLSIMLCALILIGFCFTAKAYSYYDITITNTSSQPPTAVRGSYLGVKVRVSTTFKGGNFVNCALYAELYKDGVLYTTSYSDKFSFSYSRPVEKSVSCKTDPNDLRASYTLKVWLSQPNSTECYSNNILTYSGITVSDNNYAIHNIAADKPTHNVNDTITWYVYGDSENSLPPKEGEDYNELYSGSYTITNLTTGKKKTFTNYLDPGPGMIVTYKPTEPGLYNLSVNISIKDTRIMRDYIPYGVGMHFDDGLVEVVNPARPQINKVDAAHTILSPGSENTWTVTASDGTGTLEYLYQLNLDDTEIAKSDWTTDNTYTARLDNEGSYTLWVTARDENKRTSAVFTSSPTVVSPALNIARISAPACGYIGENIDCSVSATGSTDGIEYLWKVYQEDALLTSSGWTQDAFFSFIPDSEGSFAVSVNARNAEGEQTSEVKSDVISVVSPVKMDSIGSNGLAAPTVDRRWYAYSTGGFGKISYHFRIYKGETLFKDYGWKSNNYIHTNEYTDAGEYVMVITARDENGRLSEEMTKAFTVYDSVPAVSDVQITNSTKKNYSLAWEASFTSKGNGEFKYKAVLKQNGQTQYESDWLSSDTYTSPYRYTSVGDYELTLYTRDEDGDEGEPYTIAYHVDSIPTITGVSFEPNSFRARQPFTITALTDGGEGVVTYTFQHRYRTPGLAESFLDYPVTEPSESPTLECLFNYPDFDMAYHTYTITATDEDGDTSTYTTKRIYILTAPFVEDIALPDTEGLTTKKLNWNVEVRTDRADTYVVCVLKANGEVVDTQEFGPFHTPDYPYYDTFTFSHTPNVGGEYVLEVYARDDAFTSPTEESEPFAVTEVRPVIKSITPGETELTPGQSLEWTIEAEGYGTAYSYFCRVMRNGQLYKNLGWSEGNSASFTFDEPGAYRLEVRVSNAEGFTSEFTASENVKVLCPAHQEETLEAVLPSCTEEGLTEGLRCSICGEIFTLQEIIPALGHDEQPVSDIPPSCTQPGYTGATECARCKTPMKAPTTVDPTGHTSVDDPCIEPTCATTGKTQGAHCSVCGEILIAQLEIPIDENAHTIVMDPAVKATCTQNGLTEGSHCERCGKVIVQQQPVIGWHDFDYERMEIRYAPDYSTADIYYFCAYEEKFVYDSTDIVLFEYYCPPTETEQGYFVYRIEWMETPVEVVVPPLNEMDVLYLPESLTSVSAYAFKGAPVQAVILPDSCVSIGKGAFMDCTNLCFVAAPYSIEIAPDAFEGIEHYVLFRY